VVAFFLNRPAKGACGFGGSVGGQQQHCGVSGADAAAVPGVAGHHLGPGSVSLLGRQCSVALVAAAVVWLLSGHHDLAADGPGTQRNATCCNSICHTFLFSQVAQVDPAIPLKAFLLTVVVFGCFSLAALLTPDRRFLYLYGVLSTCLLGLCVLTILNVVRTDCSQCCAC
jgi:hypothetical protein